MGGAKGKTNQHFWFTKRGRKTFKPKGRGGAPLGERCYKKETKKHRRQKPAKKGKKKRKEREKVDRK